MPSGLIHTFGSSENFLRVVLPPFGAGDGVWDASTATDADRDGPAHEKTRVQLGRTRRAHDLATTRSCSIVNLGVFSETTLVATRSLQVKVRVQASDTPRYAAWSKLAFA